MYDNIIMCEIGDDIQIGIKYGLNKFNLVIDGKKKCVIKMDGGIKPNILSYYHEEDKQNIYIYLDFIIIVKKKIVKRLIEFQSIL